jgi:hypothetical protein
VEVDSALNEISRDGTAVEIEPRTMRVLVCLAERAGEVAWREHAPAHAGRQARRLRGGYWQPAHLSAPPD